ncbi:MAG: hydrolase [Clostridiales bacterium]|nr:hydrolase [Clostridiales bacterium]
MKKKYKCPCCGYYTFREKPIGEYDICPVCFWEDDPFQADDPDLEGFANTVSLNQARENYRAFGACTESMLPHVRPPKKNELNGLDE